MSEDVMFICPTLKWARYKWEEKQRKHPDFWIEVRKNPYTLVFKDGTKYYFRSEDECPRCLFGFKGKIIDLNDPFRDLQ